MTYVCDGRAAAGPSRMAAVAIGLFVVAGCGSEGTPPEAPEPRERVLRGATVIDGSGAPPHTGWSVHIADGLIVAAGPDDSIRAPSGAEVVDLAGRWIVPGFVDVHTHLPGAALQQRFFDVLLSFGITTARSTAAAPETGVEARERLASGVLTGPTFLTAGRLIDAPGSMWDFASIVESAAEARAEVARQAEQGVDFIKLYTGLSPEITTAAIDEAHARGLPVIGHLGRTTWQQAADAGIDHLTHSWWAGLAHSLVPPGRADDFAELFVPGADFDPVLLGEWAAGVDLEGPAMDELVDALLAAGTTIDPNLVLLEAQVRGDDPAMQALLRTELDVVPQSFPHPYSAWWSEAGREAARTAYPVFLAAIATLHRRGVPLAGGSDTMNAWMTPGAAFVRELELLAEAGIAPLDVLTIATANGARAIGLGDRLGTIRPGLRADLVVLEGDPVADISNVRRVERVYLGGAEIRGPLDG